MLVLKVKTISIIKKYIMSDKKKELFITFIWNKKKKGKRTALDKKSVIHALVN